MAKSNHYLKTDMVEIKDTFISAVRQTKNGKYSANALVDQYNAIMGENKRLDNYLKLSSTQELIKQIYEEENSNTYNHRYLDDTKDAKKYCLQTVRGNNGGTYMHPLLWLDLAMWLSPKFKYYALKLVKDKVIDFRIDTIDLHNELRLSLLNLNLSVGQIIRLQTDINMCAYGVECNEIKNIRDNKANEDALNRLRTIQQTIIQMVECGIATDYCDLQKYLKNYHRKLWSKELYKKDRR